MDQVYSILFWDHEQDDRRGGYDSYSGPEEYGVWLSEDACQAEADRKNKALAGAHLRNATLAFTRELSAWTIARNEWNALCDAGFRTGEYSKAEPVLRTSVQRSRRAKEIDGVWLDDYYDVSAYAVNDGD